MRHLNLTIALVVMAALSAACGSDDDDDGAEANVSTAGSGGGSGQQSEGGAAGATWWPVCPTLEDVMACDLQTVEPTAEGDGGTVAPPCTIPLRFEPAHLDSVTVAVDCEVIPLGYPDCSAADVCWHYDSFEQPTAVVLSDALCSRITEDGFAAIDIVGGCYQPL